MSNAETINATKLKAIHLLGVNMAEAVHRDGGRLSDDQIDHIFDMCLAVVTNVENPELTSEELSFYTGAIKRAGWEHLGHLRGPHGTA